MGRRHLPDEYTLLCERCGYDIESLPKDAACPECGTPIHQSLPEARVGTPWQRSKRISALIRSWISTLRAPRAAFDAARPQTSACPRLLNWTVALAGLIPAVSLIAAELLDVWSEPAPHNPRAPGPLIDTFVVIAGGFGFLVCAALLLRFLTWIEERGIRFWGPKRGWRITPAIAKVICAHASVGWLLGSALAIPAHLLGLALMDWTNHNNAGILRGPMQLAPITLPALALIAGMLTFEVLVYIGMTRMKFANRARNTPSLDPPPPRAGEVSDEAPRV